MNKRALGLLLVLLVAAMAAPAIFAQGGPITGTAQLSLTPSVPRANVNTTFTVELKVDLTGVTGLGPDGASTPAVLGAYSIFVSFDAARLELMGVAGGTTAQYDDEPVATNLVTANSNGWVIVSDTADPIGTGTSPTGLVSVAVLTFRGDAGGIANLVAAGDPPGGSSLASAIQFGATTVGPVSIPKTSGGASVTVNTPPTANNLNPTTNEDTPVDITLTGSDPETDSLGFEIFHGPTNGTLSPSGNPRTYTPNPNFNGNDSFTYRATDGLFFSNIATVSITVNAVNDAPLAAADSRTTAEDTPLTFNLSATDVDGNPLTWAIVGAPGHGTALLTGPGPEVTYTPALNYFGADSFTFKANDGTADSNIATVTLNVTAVNDAPTAVTKSEFGYEDNVVFITLGGFDVESGVITTITNVSDPPHGSVSMFGQTAHYNPDLDYNGPDSFTYTVTDGELTSEPATVSITIEAVNDAPVASALLYSVTEDGSAPMPLVATDVDNASLTYSVVSPPAHGSFTGTAPNLSYQPAANYNGPDSFTYKANDGALDSNVATVSITVTPVNDPPVAVAGSATTDEDVPVAVTLVATDIDGDPLTYEVSIPVNGAVTGGTGSNRTFTPNANASGTGSFWFKAYDGTVDSPLVEVTITINPVDDTPVANGQNVSTDENTAIGITLTGADVETAAPSLVYAIVEGQGPSDGVLSGTPPSVTYTPNAGFSGTDSFQFTVFDGALTSAAATVNVNVAVQPATVGSLSPDTTCEGHDPFLLAVTGTNFSSGTKILWVASERTTSFGGPTSLSATIPTADVMTAGTYAVSVAKPGFGAPAGVNFTVTPDNTLPTVIPPVPLSVTFDQVTCVGSIGGATRATSTALNNWFGAWGAVDECSTAVQQPPLKGATPINADTLFGGGSTEVTFRFQDGKGNLATATTNVTVQLFGDLNSSGAVDATDLVVMSNYLVGNMTPENAPFNAPLRFANLNNDTISDPPPTQPRVDALDLVLLSNHAVGNINCLPR